MKELTGFVTGLSRILDRIAGLCMVCTMLLVITNIILRVLFNHPILGTYEYVGYLTAALIGLSLANCAVKKGHIAISFVVDRFSTKVQAFIDSFINIIALAFWGFSAWYIYKYANSLIINGVVSPTTQMPFYPFIYLVALGLLALCLVLLISAIESLKKAAFDR
ncbi:MAG: TRAP transporter small permease [Bacillota bacterium]